MNERKEQTLRMRNDYDDIRLIVSSMETLLHAHVSEARMGLVNGRDVLPSRSRNRCQLCRGQTAVQNCIGGHVNNLSDYKKT